MKTTHKIEQENGRKGHCELIEMHPDKHNSKILDEKLDDDHICEEASETHEGLLRRAESRIDRV